MKRFLLALLLPLIFLTTGCDRSSPITPSGKVVKINEALRENCATLEEAPYGNNWICVIDGDDLDAELPRLQIGKSAVKEFFGR